MNHSTQYDSLHVYATDTRIMLFRAAVLYQYPVNNSLVRALAKSGCDVVYPIASALEVEDNEFLVMQFVEALGMAQALGCAAVGDTLVIGRAERAIQRVRARDWRERSWDELQQIRVRSGGS